MAFLGLGHPADFACSATASEHIELTLVDTRRPVLAGMIDAQHARNLLGREAVSRQALPTLLAHAIPRRISQFTVAVGAAAKRPQDSCCPSPARPAGSSRRAKCPRATTPARRSAPAFDRECAPLAPR